MIIDFHTHIFSPQIQNHRESYFKDEVIFQELYDSPKARLATADELMASMEQSHIDISIALNINWSSPRLICQTNDYILESVSRYPGRLQGFCSINLNSPQDAIAEIARCARLGIKGVGEMRISKEMLLNPGPVRPIIHKIIDSGLILLLHASEPVGHAYSGKGDATPEALMAFIQSFPDLKLVCAHWGGGLPFYSLMPEVRKALTHVYFDSAASPFLYSRQIYRHVVQILGPEKILFGTDYPLLLPHRLLDEVDSLGFPEEVQNHLLSANARLLLGL